MELIAFIERGTAYREILSKYFVPRVTVVSQRTRCPSCFDSQGSNSSTMVTWVCLKLSFPARAIKSEEAARRGSCSLSILIVWPFMFRSSGLTKPVRLSPVSMCGVFFDDGLCVQVGENQGRALCRREGRAFIHCSVTGSPAPPLPSGEPIFITRYRSHAQATRTRLSPKQNRTLHRSSEVMHK